MVQPNYVNLRLRKKISGVLTCIGLFQVAFSGIIP